MKSTTTIMQKQMKAIEYTHYGAPQVLHLKEMPIPSPGVNEILIRIHASTATAADIMMRKGNPFIGRLYTGLKAPKRTILGFEFAGEVVDTGTAVTLFKNGDKVFGGTTTLGCYAEYVCVSEHDVLTTMPDNISYAEAAPVNGSAITVMNFLKGLGNIQQGQRVLINGASGGLGTYAVQIAKHYGAEVTGVCSTKNIDLVKSLGADHVIDYTLVDFTKSDKRYDIIFDTVGKRSFTDCKKVLTEDGIFLSAVMDLPLLLHMIWTKITGGKKAKVSATGLLPVSERLDYFIALKEMLRTSKIKTVIDATYPLAQVAAAHAYVETGHKRGSIVIAI